MAVRSNGYLLLNRLDTPELWTVDLSTKQVSKVLSFTGALGLTGITEISPDVFAVVTGDFNATSFDLGSGSYAVYKVDFNTPTPTSTLINKVPESEFFIGLAAFNNDTIFIADAGKGSLYTMSVSTGEYSVALSDPKMKAPADAFINEGIHGLKYRDGYLYFTNTFGGTLNKVKVDSETGKLDTEVIEINGSLDGPEDLIVTQDETVYVTTMNGGAVFKVAPDGTASTFAPVTSGSSCAFGRTESDKVTLYMTTSSGEVFSYETA